MSMATIADFRSDTVTQPTEAMYEALRTAPLGDDVFGDDPTVHALEERSADLLGKPAALFVPSGTMANSIAIGLHTRPGDELIELDDGHTYLFEAGGSARLWGVHARPLAVHEGCLDPQQIEEAVRPNDPHFPRSSLVILENTHNLGGGRVVPVERLQAVRAACERNGLRLHLDGARLFNAVVATGTPAREFAAAADTVSFCLSKGLCCPVGSMLVGSLEAVAEGRRLRKLLGGGMRQAGVLAACGLVALESGIERLAEDHARARALATALRALPGVAVENDPPDTNIVMVSFTDAHSPADYRHATGALARAGVLTTNVFGRKLRFVTHRGIDDRQVAAAVDAVAVTARSLGSTRG
ncbi:MAG: GntG family PLP-dependent aldolase [Planctomycetota bacterium]